MAYAVSALAVLLLPFVVLFVLALAAPKKRGHQPSIPANPLPPPPAPKARV